MSDPIQTTPDGAAYQSIRTLLLGHLDQDVLPFWVSARINDPSHGGHLPHLDWNLRPTGGGERHVIVQLRLLYVHAVAISRTPDDELRTRRLEQYHRKFVFLRRHYWDEEKGGFFNEPSDRNVRSKDTRSQVHAIYFLAEMFLLLGHEEAIGLAQVAFAMIDAAASDFVHGGYREHYEVSSRQRGNGIKTLGVQMHMLLALTRLYQARPEPAYLDRIEGLALLLLSHFEIPDSGGNAYNGLTHDWREIPQARNPVSRTVYGHSAELIWYMLESARVLGKDVRALIPWAARLADGVLRFGVRQSGAVYFSGAYRGSAIDKRVWWWAQAEAMIAMLCVYEVTGQARYWDGFERVRRWTFQHIVHDHTGTWIPFTNRWGGRFLRFRLVGYWQSGFHVTRALLQLEQGLSRLIAGCAKGANSPDELTSPAASGRTK